MIPNTSQQDIPLPFQPKWKRRLFIVFSLMAIIGLGVWWVSPSLAMFYQADRAISQKNLTVATVVRGDLERDLTVMGTVVFRNRPMVFSPSSGIVHLKVKSGDLVKKQQILAVVKNFDLQNQLKQEQTKLEELEIDVSHQQTQIKTSQINQMQRIELAIIDFKWAQRNQKNAELNKKLAVIDQPTYDLALNQYKKATVALHHTVQIAESENKRLIFELEKKQLQRNRQKYIIDHLQQQVEALQIRSPIDGMISTVHVKPKDAIKQNTPLLSVTDMTAFEVETPISEIYSNDLKLGLSTEIQVQGERYLGQLTNVSPEVYQGEVMGRMQFSKISPTGLKHNQRVTVRLVFESKQNVLKVRRGPFIESGGGTKAYVIKQRNAIRTTIHLGMKGIGEVEILSGLNEGDRIIVSQTETFQGKSRLYVTP